MTTPINIDDQATALVKQAIMDLLAAQTPAIQAAARYTFDQFMNRCVVLSPEPEPMPDFDPVNNE